MTIEGAKGVAEILAVAAAALFFVHKWASGYLLINASVSLGTTRQKSSGSGKDVLAVMATIVKGDRNSLELHDGRVRVSWQGGQAVVPLVGVDRRSYQTERTGKWERRIVDFQSQSRENPFLWLAPGEEATLSAWVEVPTDAVCTVEAVTLGSRCRWPLKPRLGQWRASAISAPIVVAGA